VKINVKIAERSYPLIIKEEEEEALIRKAAGFINDRILRYRTQYGNKDMQDLLAMAALQFAIKLIKMEDNAEGTGLFDKLFRMNGRLDEFLTRDKLME
jgi:cell division protein ZapA